MLMPFALGALCAAAVSGAQGWWLDSVRGIVLTSGLLFVIALFVTRRANQQILAAAAALWMGHRIADIVVLFVHGGGWRVGSRRVFCPTMEDLAPFDRIVAAGLAVASVDYRLTRLGRSLMDPLEHLVQWSDRNHAKVRKARVAFDRSTPGGANGHQ